MGNKLYKYVGPDIFEKAFSVLGKCSFKCSYPKEFNDPYELFLTINYEQRPDVLAYYQETIGNIPQYPTTCFSKSPDIIPMWAHYAHNHRGVVIEVDEEKINEYFPEISFGDIDYQNESNGEIEWMLHHALMTCKPRHVYFLQRAVISTAYYTKNTCWSYEQERRIIVTKGDDIRTGKGIMLLELPDDCVTSLIVGANANKDVKNSTLRLSEKLNCDYYELRIGRSNIKPHFVGKDTNPYYFSGKTFEVSSNYCVTCREPVKEGKKYCPWCSIKKSHQKNAASSNPMRLLDHLEMLQGYYKNCERIHRGVPHNNGD